jgi:WbqC-like protein family
MNLIVESQYFASIIFYKISYNSSNIIFEQCETYQKMSFRNRCQIAGALGVLDLSIPLVGGRGQKGLTRDVRIAGDRKWQADHWRTIVSCYNRSPWFEYYRDGLETLYRKPADFLMDWNQECLEWSLRVLGMTPMIGRTAVYREAYGPDEGVDWRSRLVPRDREKWGVAGTGSAGYPPATRYHQVFEERIGFMPYLSILDLIFCEGKEAIKYIRPSDDGKPSVTAAGASPD